jgi:hypothetical protein
VKTRLMERIKSTSPKGLPSTLPIYAFTLTLWRSASDSLSDLAVKCGNHSEATARNPNTRDRQDIRPGHGLNNLH